MLNLLNVLGNNDRWALNELYKYIHEEWPQFNEKSKIVRSPHRTIYIPGPTPERPYELRPKKRRKPGMRWRFYRALYELFGDDMAADSLWETVYEPDLAWYGWTRTLELKHVGVTGMFWSADRTTVSGWFGYDELTDTMYVHGIERFPP